MDLEEIIKSYTNKPNIIETFNNIKARFRASGLNVENISLVLIQVMIEVDKLKNLKPTERKQMTITVLNKIVEDVCNEIAENVKPANYNCPGQLVISGEYNAVEKACQILKDRGAKRALILPVSGAFHSDLMESAKKELKDGIDKTKFRKPICRIYQNFSAKSVTEPEIIKMNLLNQLTGAVLWSQSVNEMINDGINEFVEVGPGNTLQGLIRKINHEVIVSKI